MQVNIYNKFITAPSIACREEDLGYLTNTRNLSLIYASVLHLHRAYAGGYASGLRCCEHVDIRWYVCVALQLHHRTAKLAVWSLGTVLSFSAAVLG